MNTKRARCKLLQRALTIFLGTSADGCFGVLCRERERKCRNVWFFLKEDKMVQKIEIKIKEYEYSYKLCTI